ncbi:SMC-Scp complex subunit ScpB [Aliiglaciecola lipolytica]|uniref:Segregation and condensation protein B n=1 Tax=Aliiglaciecola lipolytica E3 TaxID=1127673 RepID=K6Y906_9ALTE|nr:SMC-Scp complex subunit ScpB [Aliiglaciecola lipolytica]GAC14687.1 segregation and condensation protein B [Aliiglaciecola lipolytica E3]
MAKLTDAQLKQLVEAAIFVADEPLSKDKLQLTVLEGLKVSNKRLEAALAELVLDYAPRGIQLVEVSTGFRFQSVDSLSPWLSKLWQEQAPRYSRALLETLSLIAYRQPITRGEIEDVRGVSVSSHIIKTLTEREWVKVVGHKEVPGRPALYATTKAFLDYFGLKNLAELPAMQSIEVLPEQEQEQADELRLQKVADQINSDTMSSESASTIADSEANKEQLH